MNLLRRKSVTELQHEAQTDHSLKRALGALNLTMLGIGSILGTGILVRTGTVAVQYSGPGFMISFILTTVAPLFRGLYSVWAACGSSVTLFHRGRLMRSSDCSGGNRVDGETAARVGPAGGPVKRQRL